MLACNAYAYCLRCCTTMYTGNSFALRLKGIIKPIVYFVFSKLEISGGVMVALRHASILQDAGYQVGLLSLFDQTSEYSF